MVLPEHKRLLEEHAPVIHYHGADPYRASSPATLTDAHGPDGASNALLGGDPLRVIALSSPTHRLPRLSLDLLAPEGSRYFEESRVQASGRDFISAGGHDLAQAWRRAFVAGGSVDVAFARVQPGADGRLWLQYWLFYYDNPFHVLFIGQHQGDWELIQIAHDGERATRALYFQHTKAEKRAWEDVTTVDGTHPVVFVARDSHASYFEPGHHPRLGPVEFLKRDSAATNPHPVRPTLHFFEETMDRWLLWPGRWGGTDGPIDRSPQGPRFQTQRYETPERAWDEAVDRLAAGLAQEAPPVLPPAPAVTLSLDGDAVAAAYAFPPQAERDTDPVWLRLAVHPANGDPPAVGTFDVLSLSGTVRQALPDGPGPYRVYLDVLDADENDRLIGPLDVPSTSVPEPAAAALGDDGSLTPPPRPLAVRAAMSQQGYEPIRLVVQAPHGGAEAMVDLQAAVAGEPWHVEPLFGALDPADEPELSRLFTLTRPAQPLSGIDAPGVAFQAARELDLGPDWTVEADVPSSVLVPDPEGDDQAAALGDAAVRDDWALSAIHAQDAWALVPAPGGQSMGAGIVIGQPDTGYTKHYELQMALDLLRARDVLDGDENACAVLRGFPPLRFPSHGTGTASVAVSRSDCRVVGSAPRALVAPIRTARSVILIRNAELAVAVNHARMVGCRVISISLGGIALPTALRVAIKRAVEQGVIVMAAAGQPLPAVVQPACFPECLAVAATTPAGTPWALSARGPEVDWSAPGSRVLVAHTANDGEQDVAFHSGTSFSVALSAGVAALWLAHHGPAIRKTFDPPEVQAAFRSLVRETVTPPPPGWSGQKYGPGIINARNLLEADLREARPSASLGSADPVDRIAAFGELSAAALRTRLSGLFTGGDTALAHHADELAFRVAEHAAVRAEVFGDSAAAGLGGDVSVSPLAAVASPALRAALTG